MTLAQALQEADRAPDVLIARAAEVAAGAWVDATGAPGPFSFGLATHSVSARESISFSATLRWAGQRRTAVEASRAEFAAAGGSREMALAGARRAIRLAWSTVAAGEAAARIATGRAERAERTAEAVRELYDAGRVPRLDRARAVAEAAVAASDRDGAIEAVGAASALLAFLLGRPAGAPLVTAGDVPAPAPEDPLEKCIARAAISSPGVRLEELRLRAADARVTLAGKNRLPGLSVEAGADFDDPTQPGTDKYAGLGLTIPLGADARKRVALAERDGQTLALDREKRSAAAEAEASWRRTKSARLRFETLDRVALPAAREAADLGRIAYTEGRSDLLRLLDAERALADIESSRWEAWFAWAEANAQLLWFTGEDR